MPERFNIGLFQHFRKCEWDDCELCEEFKHSKSFKMRYPKLPKEDYLEVN